MKKLVFSAAAVAMMVGMYSCGGSSTKTVADGDAIKAKIENCKDPDSLKIYVQQAKDHAMNLMAKGDSTAAAAYIKDIAPAVRQKDASVAAEINAIAEQANYTTVVAVDSAKTTVANAADSVKNAAASAYDAVKGAVSEKAGEVKDASVDAYNSARTLLQRLLTMPRRRPPKCFSREPTNSRNNLFLPHNCRTP